MALKGCLHPADAFCYVCGQLQRHERESIP